MWLPCCMVVVLSLLISCVSHQVSASCDPSCSACPCFLHPPRPLSLPDNIQTSTVIASLAASFTSNAPPFYSLTGSTDFAIDFVTGAVTVEASLDYTMESTYSLTIQAYDSSDAISTILNITLVQTSAVGDSLVCTEDVVQGEILEGDVNSQIPLPSCFNGDGSQALVSDLVFTISSGNANSLFHISPPGSVSNLAALDYEADVLHTLVIGVMNSELPPRIGTLTVIVTVTPVNEFPPVFTSDPMQLLISEAVAVGSVIGQVEATDLDFGEDGRITYSLIQSPSDVVFIHPVSGTVILTDALDFESDPTYNMTVVATDNSPGLASRMSASATLSILVQDSNDSPPSFARVLFSVSVQEDSSTGHVLTTLSCSDQDTGINSEVTYSITSGNDGGVFGLDDTTGMLTLMGTLDFDVGLRLYSLTVQCRETQPPNMEAESLVLIQVTSFNEFNPDPGGTYTANVREDTAAGSLILQVRASDRDYGPAGLLQYYINNNNNINTNFPHTPSAACPDNLFMDSSSGEMYLMMAFDHESGRTSYHCTLSVWDSERPIHYMEQDIFITVVNVNDAVPVCTPSASRLEVPEDASVGVTLLSLSCRDPDSANLQYALTEPSTTGFQVSQSGELSLGVALDYETQPLYILSVSVSDGEFTTNTTIYLTVTGVNEHAPIFATPTPDCSIAENSIYGSSVCSVQAEDADSGDDGSISFDFVNPTTVFEIDPSTGDIYVVGDIDFETAPLHSLVVRVTDGGDPPLTNEIAVNVTVRDENDHSPQVPPYTMAAVPEDAVVGTLVTSLDCRDADQSNTLNSNTVLTITGLMKELPDGTLSPVATPLFNLASATGDLTTAEGLDYESASLYHLSVTCRDQGMPSLATPTTVHIQVTPVNKFTPTFTQVQYEVTIAEGVALGTSVTTLQANDGDRGQQGDVSYSIITPTSSPFWLDPQTGELYVVERLQCHLETRHTLTIRARDGGSPSLESTADLIVNIDPCQFGGLVPSSSVYLAEVVENSAVGTSVLTASCSSSRALPALRPSYQLTQPSSVFRIDDSSGVISLSSSPDYEQAPSHLLHVRCFDSNHPDTHADVVAFISIQALNEHAPSFSLDSYTFTVSESTGLGARVGQVRATDGDAGRDGEVIFSIPNSTDVLVNRDTGELFLARELDREESDALTLRVLATDNPSNETSARTSSALVTLDIEDSNDNWPVCSRTVYHVHTSPDTVPPSVIFSDLGCADDDIGPNARLSYSLGDTSDDKFSIHSTTGALSLTDTLDPEDAVTYRVPVVVRDDGATPLSITLLLIVDLRGPPLELPGPGLSDREYLSLVDAEGRENAVNITLKDFSRPIWEQSAIAMENFHAAVARSVTSHCAIFPEACSLVVGCAQFFGSSFQPNRRKRSSSSVDETSNYANFTQPHVVILPNSTTELKPLATSNEGDTVSLKIEFYVKLPDRVDRSPNRATNYVVPKATLKQIVREDNDVIGAVVRNSVAPSLTEQILNGWRVVATVCLVIISVAVTAAIVAAVSFAAYKYWERSKNRVVPFKPSKPKKRSSNSRTQLSTPNSPVSPQSTPSPSSAAGPSTISRAHIFITASQTDSRNPNCVPNDDKDGADEDRHKISAPRKHALFATARRTFKPQGIGVDSNRSAAVAARAPHGEAIDHRTTAQSTLGTHIDSNYRSAANGTSNYRTSAHTLSRTPKQNSTPPSLDSSGVSTGVHRSTAGAKRASVGSGSVSSNSDSSGISNVSMRNQVSREGSGGSSRRLSSSEDFDQSHGSGGGLVLQDCGEEEEEEEDYLGDFPFTRPGNPVRTNGLSMWKMWR